MEKLVLNPYLPNNNVKSVLLGTAAISYQNELSKLGINPLFVNGKNALPPPLNGHIDMLVNHYSDNLFYIEKGQNKLFNKLTEYGVCSVVIKDNIKAGYPDDVKLNCIKIGNTLICNVKTIAKEIIKKASSDGCKILNVNQGYTKCSVLIVNKNAVITDDESVFSSLNNSCFDTLLVKKGSVMLPNYNYGFIGGCGGMISKNEIVFFGDIKKHDSYENIKSFLNNYKIQEISLSNENLSDIGSMIPLTECEE